MQGAYKRLFYITERHHITEAEGHLSHMRIEHDTLARQLGKCLNRYSTGGYIVLYMPYARDGASIVTVIIRYDVVTTRT